MKRSFYDVGSEYWGLKCPHWGNEDTFLEIMTHESHLVDGRLNYLHLVDGVPEQYECGQCLQVVQPANHPLDE